MNLQTTLKSLVISIVILFLFTSCSKDELDQNFDATAITVKLKGADDNLQNLLIDIQDVQLLVGTDENIPSDWLSLNILSKGIFNVSHINSDNELLLVDAMSIPSGAVQKIKLVLGDDNAIIIHNQSQPLESDSDELASSNIISKTLEANKRYEFTLEFESDNSIIMNTDESIKFIPKMNTLIRHSKF